MHEHEGNHEHGGDAPEHDHRSFDERARDWDDETKVDRARVVAAAIRAAVSPDATTRLLEYGAGTGLVTQFLAEGALGHVTLADPSAGMRGVMADKSADGRLPSNASIIELDLAGEDIVADSQDLVIAVMALHHVDEPRPVLSGAATVLATGGHLCIVDLYAEDGSFHADTEFEVHDGFDEAELTDWLHVAGFSNVTFAKVHDMLKDGSTYPLFLAVARQDA